jgi:hypothetical protein
MRPIPLLLALLLPHLAAAQSPQLKQEAAPAALVGGLPDPLGPWQRGAVTDFEQRPGGAGLGAAVEYRPAGGGAGVATIYLYDRGRADLAPAAIPGELDAGVREIEMVGPIRRYRIEARAEGPVVPPFTCTSLLLGFEGGPRAESTLCVGLSRGRFLKLRVTLPAGEEGEGAKTVATLATALAAATR